MPDKLSPLAVSAAEAARLLEQISEIAIKRRKW